MKRHNTIASLITAACAVLVPAGLSAAMPSTSITTLDSYSNPGESHILVRTSEVDILVGSASKYDIDYTTGGGTASIMNFRTIGRKPTLRHSFPTDDIKEIRYFDAYTTKITRIECDNEQWDGIYLTPRGYFAERLTDAGGENDAYREIVYMSFDGCKVRMTFDAATALPLSLISDETKLTFNIAEHYSDVMDDEGYITQETNPYLRDVSILMDVEQPKPMEYDIMGGPITMFVTTSVPSESDDYLIALNYFYPEAPLSPENPFAKELYSAHRLFEAIVNAYNYDTYPIVTELSDIFRSIYTISEIEGCGENGSIDLPSGIGSAMGAYQPAGSLETISNIVVMTQGSKDIKDTSATLQGAVRCHSSKFRTAGKYGIIVDTDKEKVAKGEGSIDLPGNQGKLKLSFDVKASGLEPNTTYYYRAYYKLNKGADGLAIKFDNRDPNKVSDKTPTETYGDVKSFTTAPPDISGVWHFVNSLFADNLYFELYYDKHTGKYRAKDGFYGIIKLEVEVHRDRFVTLRFYTSFSGATASGYFDADYSSAKGTGINSYQQDSTPFTLTR